MHCFKVASLFFFLIFISSCKSSETKIIESPFSSFDETKIAYTDEGDGEPVLLIHGFISNGSSWNKTVLKKSLIDQGYRVIVPDLRGNGKSDKPQNAKAYQNDAEIKDLIGLADYLQLDSYMTIGYSRGSIVLAKLLTKENRISKAVIGGMGVDFTNPDWDRELMFAAAFRGETTPETEGAVAYAKSINADLKSLHLQQKHQPVTSVAELKTIKAKVLVIAGKEDTDNGHPKALQKAIPKSRLKIVPGDHNGTYKTAKFSKAICSFL